VGKTLEPTYVPKPPEDSGLLIEQPEIQTLQPILNHLRNDWKSYPFRDEDKTSIIMKASLSLEATKKDLLTESVDETAIPIRYLDKEFNDAVDAIRHIPDIVNYQSRILQDQSLSSQLEFGLTWKGRVLILTPWNSPMLSQLFLPCLSYFLGNVTILKPSSRARYNSVVLEQLLNSDINVKKTPHRRLFLILASSEDLLHVVDDEWLDYVYFMGSRSHGIEWRAKFHGSFFGEYEGNNIGIVNDYSNSDLEVIMRSFLDKNGYDCDCLRGLFVKKSCYEGLVQDLKKRFENLSVGDPHLYSSELSAKYPEAKLLLEPDTRQIIVPHLGPSLWVSPYTEDSDLREKLVHFFGQSKFGLSVMILSDKDPNAWVEYLKRISFITRFWINLPLSDFTPYLPWGGRGHTSDFGAISWVQKFSDVIVVKRGK